MSASAISKPSTAGLASQTQTQTEMPDTSRLYIMYFRHGMNAGLTKGFYHNGDIFSAARRAREHCRIMGYRYIFVRPLIVDIESEETYKLKGIHNPDSLEMGA